MATFDSERVGFDRTCWTFDGSDTCAFSVEIERALPWPRTPAGFYSTQLRFDQTCWTFDGSSRCAISVEIENSFAPPYTFGAAGEVEVGLSPSPGLGFATEVEATFAPLPPWGVLSPYHRDILRALAERFGISSPVSYTATSPTDGAVVGATLVQHLVGGVLTTVAGGPNGDNSVDCMDAEAAGWLEALARRHGLIDPIADTGTLISDGTFAQSVAVSGNTATYTRLS